MPFMYNWAMFTPVLLQPVDYLVIGHITHDIHPSGPRVGGTATYAALTARALGLRVGIVTSYGGDLPIPELEDIPLINYPAESSTIFENIKTPLGRIQYIRNIAPVLNLRSDPRSLAARTDCPSWSRRPGGRAFAGTSFPNCPDWHYTSRLVAILEFGRKGFAHRMARSHICAAARWSSSHQPGRCSR